MKIGIYGGTFNLFNVTMRKMGVDFNFKTYVRFGAPISFVVLAASLAGLWIVL